MSTLDLNPYLEKCDAVRKGVIELLDLVCELPYDFKLWSTEDLKARLDKYRRELRNFPKGIPLQNGNLES